MLHKLGKLLIIIVIIGGLGYIAFLVFMNPSGFTNKEDLIKGYFNNISSESACEDHFNSETLNFCDNFQNLIETRTIEITDLLQNGDNYKATVLIDDVEIEFIITFIEIEVTGLKSFLNTTYYEIDFIE